MIDETTQGQAFFYLLSALSEESAREFETSLASNAELEALVRDLRRMIGRMSESLGDSSGPAPSATVKKRLLERLPAKQTVPANPPFSFFLHSDKQGWTRLRKGWEVRRLTRTKDYVVVLVKMAAGTRYPSHDHLGPEECYVLEGTLEIGGREIKEGDFHHAEGGTHHIDSFTRTGCTCLLIISALDAPKA